MTKKANSSFLRSVMIALFVARLFSGFSVRAEPIDRVIASVNNDVITLSDLRQAMAFNSGFSPAKENGRKLEAETLEGLINGKLLLQEASRLRYAEVTDQEAAAEAARLRERFGTSQAYEEFMTRTGLTEVKLVRMLGDRLLVERFVQKKIGLYARVGRDEAELYYREHQADFPGKRFAEVQKRISDFLAAEKTDQHLDQYLAELRNRADIRMNSLGE